MLNMTQPNTPIQCTLWAEIIGGGTQCSVDELSTVPLFTGKGRSKIQFLSDMWAVFMKMAKSCSRFILATKVGEYTTI